MKYRGFFIDDENPDLGTWGPRFFGPGLAPGFPGGFDSKLYARVFETILRLKANYLWPAVWAGRSPRTTPEPRHRQGVRRGDGHLPRGAHDARHRGVEPPRRGGGP